MKNTIILCAGKSKFSNSLAMIPVNGKPVIGWILDDLLQKGINEIVLVIRPEDQRLINFINWAYAQRMTISFAIPEGETILYSVLAGLQVCESACPIRIVLGDTLIRDDFDAKMDFVYTGKVEDARRWCLVTTYEDGRVLEYLDKPGSFSSSNMALAGYYGLSDGDYLRQIILECLQNQERELSAALRRYDGKYPIYALQAREWYDFGHIDNLVDARRRLLQPRYFNTLKINPLLNTIMKVSQNNQKLQDELDWYLTLPNELQVLTPRILQHDIINGQLQFVQEYYGYPTLAELYVYGDLDIELWESILRNVMRVHREFGKYTGELSAQEIYDMYIGKTCERLELIMKQDTYWDSLLQQQRIEFNGQTLNNFYEILPELKSIVKTLSVSGKIHIIHGDFCFSNILFDVNNQIIRLIDPRGHFGRKGIYGDSRYDIAKLRHSISGLYDFIVADMFKIEESRPGIFSGQSFANSTQKTLGQYFDQLVVNEGYSLSEIRLIEGLLFISMLPYHKGHPQRQQMLYLTGLNLLDEVLNAHCN